MSNKILMKFFAKIGKNWRVVKKLKVWGTAQNLAQFITAMEYLYKFKKQDGYGNVTLTIPAASNTGDKHRLKAKGIKNESTRRTGDMYVILEVKNPKKLSKEQKKLLEQLNETILDSPESIEFDKFVKSNDR